MTEKIEAQQARAFQVVINNWKQHGLTKETILQTVATLQPDYYCYSEEVGKNGTPHVHIYFTKKNPWRFQTVKNKFPFAHIEKAYGSAEENRDYVAKEGKWAGTEKSETKIDGSFCEFGVMPRGKETSDKTTKLLTLMKEGYTDLQILEEYPELGGMVKVFPIFRELVNAEKTKEYRAVNVTYLYGVSGTGKTRYIFDNYPIDEIYRITNYPLNGIRFDGYSNQTILVFEEFSGKISIQDMLNYLDVYPIKLPARYTDHAACYTKVFITSNLSLDEQYAEIDHSGETWKAFLRRITNIVHFIGMGEYVIEKGDLEIKKAVGDRNEGGEVDEGIREHD